MTLTDGSILRRIGLQLQRDECGVAKPVQARCAWCDAEAGIKPHPGMNQSHTICDRHLAAIKADLERRRLAEAA